MVNFNDHMHDIVVPRCYIVIDECMSSYEGSEGKYTIRGPPNKTKIARKPRGVRAEFKSAACGESKLIIRLELQEGKERMATREFVAKYGPAVAVTLRLVKPWAHTDRVIIGDSAFGGVKCGVAADVEMRFHMTALVKQCSSQYPKALMAEHDKTVVKDV